jgi:hypothetical protein
MLLAPFFMRRSSLPPFQGAELNSCQNASPDNHDSIVLLVTFPAPISATNVESKASLAGIRVLSSIEWESQN